MTTKFVVAYKDDPDNWKSISLKVLDMRLDMHFTSARIAYHALLDGEIVHINHLMYRLRKEKGCEK
jgi:hypothetical protein